MKYFLIVFMLCILFISCKEVDYTLKVKRVEGRSEEELILNNFLHYRMNNASGAIYTNYKDDKVIDNLPTGHQILSETIGLQMLYYIYVGDKDSFDRIFYYTRDTMQGDKSYIPWRYHDKVPEIANSSATIDDLRIAKAMYLAHKYWNISEYLDYFHSIRLDIENHGLLGHMLVDFYDESGKSSIIELSYLDLQAFKLFAKYDKRWEKVYKESLKVLKGGVDKTLPLYSKRFDIKEKKYSNRSRLNLIEAIYPLLYLAIDKQDISQSIDWIKGEIENHGSLYAYYQDGSADTSTFESTALYALVMRIAKVIDDKELYDLAYSRAIKMQVTNSTSPVYGAFDSNNHQIYSFDNLQMLLALNKSYIYTE